MEKRKTSFSITGIVLGILALALMITVMAKNCAAVRQLSAEGCRPGYADGFGPVWPNRR